MLWFFGLRLTTHVAERTNVYVRRSVVAGIQQADSHRQRVFGDYCAAVLALTAMTFSNRWRQLTGFKIVSIASRRCVTIWFMVLYCPNLYIHKDADLMFFFLRLLSKNTNKSW